MGRKTNKQLLQKFVREVDDIYLAFVVAELLASAERVLKHEDEVREEMKDSMVHPDLWLSYHRQVQKYLEQDK